MTKRSKGLVVALMLSVAALATPAAAQELSLGYQMQRFSSEGDSLNAPFGVNVSLAGPGSGAMSVVGQVDWSRRQESQAVLGTSIDATATFAAFAGGLRWSGRGSQSATPFFDALFGVMRTSGSAHIAGEKIGSASETDPMLQLGGGVSVPIAGALGAFGQFDYRRIFADGVGVNAVRFVAGIRLSAR